MNKEKIRDWIKKNSKQYMIDSTALLIPTTPIFAGLETIAIGMSNEVSTNARVLVAGLTYAGMGSLFTKGRDGWRKLFKVNDKSKEITQTICDTAYTVAYNAAVSPLFYLGAGSRDFKEILAGTAVAMGIGAVSGGLVGYGVDAVRDLTGIKESDRLPRYVKNLSPKVKKAVAVGLLAGSLALTSGIYKANNMIHPNNQTQAQTVTQNQGGKN